MAAVAEHPVPQIGLHPDGGAEDGHAPQKAAEHNCHHHDNHGHTDPIQQEIHIEGNLRAIQNHIALVHAVDDHLIQLGDLQLQIVHGSQREQAQQKQWGVLQIIAVDMLAEYHCFPFLLLKNSKKTDCFPL